MVTLSPMRELFTFTAHADATTAVSLISPSQLLTGGADGTVRADYFFLLSGRRRQHVLSCPLTRPWRVRDVQVCLWRLDEEGDSERRCTTFEGHRAPVVCLYGDGDKVVSGARDGTVRCWDVAKASLRFMLQGYTAFLGSLQVGPTWFVADGTNNAVSRRRPIASRPVSPMLPARVGLSVLPLADWLARACVRCCCSTSPMRRWRRRLISTTTPNFSESWELFNRTL